MKKVITAIFAVAVMCLFSFSVFAKSIPSEEQGKLLINMGILDESFTGEVLNEPINKTEFAQILARMVFFGDSNDSIAEAEQFFSDVGNYHYAANDIARLAALGIISGNGDGNFGVSDMVSEGIAYKMMLDSLGYSQAAATLGDFPKNYFKLAGGTNIAKGVTFKDSSAITKGEAVRMFYNLMFENMMDMQMKNGGAVFVSGEQFMRRMGLECGTGVLNAVGAKTLISTQFADDRICIDSTVYYSENREYSDYIGCIVQYFYDKEDNVVGMAAMENETIELKSSDIQNYDSGYVNYYDYGLGRKKRAELSQQILIMYNGYTADSLSQLIPTYGRLKLLDNDCDGKYDVAFVEDFENYKIDVYNKNERTIYISKDNGTSVGEISLDDYKICEVLNDNGENVSPDSLSGYISVKRNGSYYLEIIMSNRSENITVSQYYDEDGVYYINSEESEYMMAPMPYFVGWNGGIRVNVTLYFDAVGGVMAVEAQKQDGWMVGYIIRAKNTETNDGEEVLGIKLFTEDGVIKTYLCDKKMRIDDVRITNSIDYEAELNSPQIIRFYIKDERISKIDRAQNLAFDNAQTTVNSNDNDLLFKRAAGRFLFKGTDLKAFKRHGSMTIDGEIYIKDKEVPIFSVPEDSKITSAAKTEFGILSIVDLTHDGVYELEGYTFGTDTYYTNYILLKGGISANRNTAVLDVVNGVKVGLDSDDIPVKILKTYRGENVVDSSANLDSLVDNLLPGDVIRYLKNSIGQINDIELVYSTHLPGGLISNTIETNATSSNSSGRVVKGYAADVNIDERMMLFKSAKTDTSEFIDVKRFADIIVFDPDEVSMQQVYGGTIADIKTKATSASDHDVLIMLTSFSLPKTLVILKNR